jgi:hypothetical protein
LTLIEVGLRELRGLPKVASRAALFRVRELADVPSDLSIRGVARYHQLGGVNGAAEQAGECLHELLHQDSERQPEASIIVVIRISLLVPLGKLLLLFHLFWVSHHIEQTHAEEPGDLRILHTQDGGQRQFLPSRKCTRQSPSW